ncbi:MAG TPA: FAD binding domain-containing protein, partial [Hyphomonadaceae bacterium]|nr:FAD binding domain-containing protein [Hyphomonadaceae bacterium]
MSGIQYLAPSTVADAVRALEEAKGAGRILAGGTDLIVQMRGGRAKPGVIIDIKRIPGMLEIRVDKDGFLIGAAVPGVVLGEHEALRRAWPGVIEAANLIGSTQVQGRASLGGNLCNASPAADGVPALIAAGAICIVEGSKGRREVPVELVQAGPGRTSLAPDEILVAFRLPTRPSRS